MRSHAFTIELLEDMVISRRPATLGGHESLDYLPGQTLLGACAARLYERLGQERAYLVFHSGRVRFGNAWPLAPDGQPAWPVPLAWHEKKAQPAKGSNGWLDPTKVYNFQHRDELEDGAQPRQLRTGYLDATGRLHEPTRYLRMKTAIDPSSGRAAEAQLFGYEAIARGTRLGGWIEADEDIDGSLFAQVTNSLEEELLLGRSRSAEYGRVRLGAVTFRPPPPGALLGSRLTLWLLSDLAVADDWGQPTLEPQPRYLGLPKGTIDRSRTFIRTRRYAPWNGARGAPDVERSVIQQGSVITYALETVPASALLDHCAAGLGLHRECGLGRVWINPPLLADGHPALETSTDQRAAAPDNPASPNHPLVDWLRSQVSGNTRRQQVEQVAREIADDFETQRRKAARERGLPASEDFGPSRSQWGRVLDAARSLSGNELLARLFEGDNAIVKSESAGWGELFFDHMKMRQLSLAQWLSERLHAEQPWADLARVVQRLAHLCREKTGRR
ncbi:MAG: hypothetical protein ACREXW_03260 [Gammaproteobacteria bacterium]